MPGHKSDYSASVTLKFNADADQAKKELQELQKQLNSLGTLSNPKVGDKLSADMQKASQAAAQLKIALDSAIDVDTGKLDLSKFSRSLKDSGMKLKDYRDQLMSMGPEGEKAFTQVANSILKAEAPLRRTSELIDTMWTTLKNTARWELSSSILHGLESSLQKAVTYAQDLNKSLTDIRIVTGYSTDHMAEFAIEANKAAKALSATTTEYTNASLIYFQQGLSDQQVKERTEVTVKMANVTRDSAQTVSDQMTAVWNNFADGSHTLEYYADVMTALGAATASSTKEISDGLEKFAAVAETVGLSYEYAASALATITSNTRQSADVVGTALKTLFARIQGLSLGETLEDGTDLNKYSEALAKVGIQVKEQNGELKAMDDILNEMANVWDKLNNDQQVALAQTVAGVRQYTQLVALMENWDNGDEDSMMANLRTSANATGALQEQADIYAESWEAARDRVTAALESIFNKLLKDEFFIDTLNSIEKIIIGIDKFIDSIGGLQGVLTGLGAVATKVFSSQISSGLSNLAYNLNFKQVQENTKNIKRKAANLESSMLADAAENANPAKADAYRAIGQIQVLMIDHERDLNEEQKKSLNYDIERLKVLAEQLELLDQEKEKVREQSKEKSDKNRQKSQDAYEYHKALEAEQEKDINDEKRQKSINELRGNYVIDRDKDGKELIYDSAEKAYKEHLKAVLNLEKKVNKEIKAQGKATENTTKELEKAEKELEEIENIYKNIGDLNDEEIIDTKDIFKKEIESTNKYENAREITENEAARIKKDAGSLKSLMDKTESITQLTNGIMSLSFGFTSLASSWETISNPDATAWEKINAVFVSMPMGIMSSIDAIKSMGSGLINLIATITAKSSAMTADTIITTANTLATQGKKAADIKAAIAENGSTAATKLHAGAQLILNGHLGAGLSLLLPYIIGIVALTAAISGIVFWYNKWKESTPEAQLEKVTEETEKASEQANIAEEAYKNLKNTIESYDNAVNALENLTEDTEEFKKAVEEANEKARELIDTYGIIEGVSIDKNGLITIDEKVLKEKQENYFDASKATTGSEYILKEEQKELTVEVDNKELINNFIKDNKIYGNSETAKEVYADPEKLNQLIGALQDLEDSTIENDETAKILIATLFNQDKNSIEFSKNLDSLLSASSAKLISLADQLGLNTNALLSNTDALVFAANMLQGNETYENSEYKNTLALAYDEAYKNAFENSEIDTFSEAQEALGIGKVVSSGQTIEENGKTLKTYNYNGGVYTEAEIINLAKSIEANTAAVTAVESKQSYLEALSPTAAQITEITNSSYASTGSYNKDLEIYNYAKSNNQYGTYEDFLKNFNPYEDIENKIAEDFKGKDISTIINGETLGEGDTANVIKNWWAGLSDEDKTVALNIEYDKGQWQEQLNALKAESVYTETAEQTGYSEEAVKSYTQSLMATNEAYKENEYMASLAAQQQLNFAKGVSDASQILEDNKDILKDADENSMEYHEALGKLNIALEQMFGTKFSYEYLKDNFDTVKDAVNGDTEAIQILREEASKQILIDIGVDSKQAEKKISDLYKQLSSLDIGESVGDEFLEMFNQLIEEAELTKEEVENILNSMGLAGEIEMIEPVIEPDINLERAGRKWQVIEGELTETKSVPIQYEEENPMETTTVEGETEQGMTTDSTGTMTLTPPEGSGQQAIEYQVESHITTKTSGETNLLVPTLKDAKVVNNKQSLGKVGDANASSGSSSGGGSGSNAEPLEYEDEIERYHENTRALERLERALEKVSKAKDRAFGKERLRLIDEEIAATERLVGQQRAYIAEAKQYLKQDFAEIQQYGFTTDQYGELTNYDEVMKQQIDKYNAAVATGNQDAIDAAKKQYDEFKENMEQYEETLTLYEEAQAQLQDYINQVVDLKLEKITTEVEIKLRVNDKELTKLEYLLKKIEYEGKGAADAIGLIGKQFEQVNQKAETVREAIDKIYKQAREEGRGFTDEEIAEAQALYEGGLTPEEEIRLQEIHQKVIDEDRALTQAEEDQILEYQEMLLEYNSEVMDYVETVEGKFIETFDELNGAVDETIGRFATYTGMLETLKDVITLTGKANTKYGKDLMSQFSARTVANASAAMRSNIASYNNLNKQYEAQQESLARAIEAGDERFIQTQKEYLEHVELAREAAYEAMLTSWSDVLQASSDLFDARLDEMIFNLKQNLGDIDTLVEIYDRAVELEELYVSGNKSIYELSKLARDIGKDIDATSNLIAKNKLTGLLEQINKLRAEGVKLSEYDLEYWQAKYELELAEIALQEAQEAKSQIKLTRNNAGGWGYTYVADAEAIAEAEQNYEDSLYNMQSIHEEYISDYSERFLKNQQEMADELHNIDKERADYEEEVMRVRDHYFRQQEYLMNELNKAYERSGIGFKDTILGQQSEFSTLEQYYQNFIDSSSEMIETEFIDSYKLWQQQVQDANNEMGKNLEDFAEDISNTSDTLEDKVISKIDEMGITMEETSNKIWDFQETYGAAIAEMIKANEEFFDKTAKDYNNFISKTAIGEYLKNQEAFMSTGDVLGLTGKGGMGATGYGGLGVAGSASSALNGWLGSLNSATGRSSGSKSGGSKNSIVLGDGGSEGVHLRADGTYSGIATISAGEERIPEAAMRALREDPALKGIDLSSYGGDDNSLSASELKKLFKDKNVDYSKYTKDNDDVKKFGITLATGGYTGSWGPDARWAMLHEKELVLNKYDTENMLDMVNTLRDIDWRAKLSELFGNIQERLIIPISGGRDNLQQDVHIEANFPGISDRNELTEAFNNLINTASQYANRRRY